MRGRQRDHRHLFVSPTLACRIDTNSAMRIKELTGCLVYLADDAARAVIIQPRR